MTGSKRTTKDYVTAKWNDKEDNMTKFKVKTAETLILIFEVFARSADEAGRLVLNGTVPPCDMEKRNTKIEKVEEAVAA